MLGVTQSQEIGVMVGVLGGGGMGARMIEGGGGWGVFLVGDLTWRVLAWSRDDQAQADVHLKRGCQVR